MTERTFKSKMSNNAVIWHPEDSVLGVLAADGSGYRVTLSPRDRRKLALELLDQDYEAIYDTTTGDYELKKRPRAKVGEYYRVNSTPGMIPDFQGNPIVKVTEAGAGGLTVETVDGAQSSWPREMRNLVGPLKVAEQVTWLEVPE